MGSEGSSGPRGHTGGESPSQDSHRGSLAADRTPLPQAVAPLAPTGAWRRQLGVHVTASGASSPSFSAQRVFWVTRWWLFAYYSVLNQKSSFPLRFRQTWVIASPTLSRKRSFSSKHL